MRAESSKSHRGQVQVLYFDVKDLLLSDDYLDRHPNLKSSVTSSLSMIKSTFLNHISLDAEGVKLLNNFSLNSKILLYPLGTLFNRDFLTEQGIADECLVNDKRLPLRLNDTNDIRRLLAHAHSINADWRVAGNLFQYEMQLSYYSYRYIKTDSSAGVTANLIKRISESFQNQQGYKTMRDHVTFSERS